jgi:hypothetical protein
MPLANLLLVLTLLVTYGLPTATLSGQVATGDGSPVPGVQVELIEAEGAAHRPLGVAKTDARGRYRIDSLVPGRHAGWIQLGDSRRSFAVALVPGANRKDLTLRESVLHGVVLSSEGEPVADATVSFEGEASRVVRSAEDGTFAFLVQAAIYQLSVRKEGYALAAKSALVEVPEGSLAVTELRLTEGAALRGRLRGLSPEEQLSATVLVKSHGPWQGAFVQEDGTFHLDGLAPGTWDVRAWSGGHSKHAEGKVTLVGGQEAVLDLAFAYHRLRGHAFDSEGNPVAGRTLEFLANSELKETPTGTDGAFEVELHDGAYLVSSFGNEACGESQESAEPLPVDDHASLSRDVEIHLAPAASVLRGHLLGLLPGEGEDVSVVAVRGGLERYAPIEDGKFELADLSPGEWKITVRRGEVQVQSQVTLPLRSTVSLDLVLPPRPDSAKGSGAPPRF